MTTRSSPLTRSREQNQTNPIMKVAFSFWYWRVKITIEFTL